MIRGDLVKVDGRRGFIRAVVAIVPPERSAPIRTEFEVTLFGGRGTVAAPPERVVPLATTDGIA